MPVAIVTGATRGLGRALALALARDGWDLVVNGRRGELVNEVTAALSHVGVAVVGVSGDVTDSRHRERLIEASTQLGSLELVVNNASSLGVTPLPSLRSYPLEELRRIYEVNVVAPFALTQEALTSLRESRGVVVSVSSDAATEPYEGWGAYGSSKAALDQLFRVWSLEEPTIRWYGFDPGDMRTEMHQAAFPGEDISDRPEPETVVPTLLRLIASDRPSGRYRNSELELS